jgi:F0F1-type ATP synthase membrane subunit a
MVLGLLVSFVQALVFMLLATVYFAGAMEEAH